MSHSGVGGGLALIVALAFITAPAVAAILPHMNAPAPTEGPPALAGSSPSIGAEGSHGNTMGDDRGGTHSFRLSELRPVSVDGIDYYAFSLDPEETNPGHSRDGSLDVLRLYAADRGDIRSIEALSTEGDLLLDLLAVEGAGWIRGGGPSDHGERGNRAEYLVPSSLCRGVDQDRYLYLYSRFAATSGGHPHRPSRGNEGRHGGGPHIGGEHHDVSEPATLLLMAPGLLAAALARRRTHP